MRRAAGTDGRSPLRGDKALPRAARPGDAGQEGADRGRERQPPRWSRSPPSLLHHLDGVQPGHQVSSPVIHVSIP